jgi:PTS system mannitol-specific IIC component
MAGNICALSFFTLVDFGLVAPASPGSLISIILMSPKGKTLLGILGVLIGTAVSFLLSWPMIKSRPDFQGESEEAKEAESAPVREEPAPVRELPRIDKIVFACDAGMGSSALGATRFKSRMMKAGIEDVKCTNCPVGEIPADASIVVCQHELAERARLSGKHIVAITNFLSDPALDALLDQLQMPLPEGEGAEVPEPAGPEVQPAGLSSMLRRSNIFVGLKPESKEAAIRRAGELLAASGYVEGAYVEAMLEREKLATTYMGMGLAIPHGTAEAKASVLHSGVVVLQYPEGVDFGGGKARLIIGIAGAGDEHLEILAKVSTTLDDPEVLELLCTTTDADVIFRALN